MKYAISLFILLLLVSHYGFSQAVVNTIETDRPDQTESPAIVPKGCVQVEVGFVREHDKEEGVHTVAYSYPSLLAKYGVNKRLELRLIIEHTRQQEEILNQKNIQSGVQPVAIGFKVNITQEKGIVPRTSLIAHGIFPTLASDAYKGEKFAPEFRFTMQHTLSDKVNLGYNLGMEWDVETPKPTYIYTLTTGFSINDRLGLYIEGYGFYHKQQPADNRLDGGITYLLKPNILLDISGGLGISKIAPGHFVGIGFSFRVPR